MFSKDEFPWVRMFNVYAGLQGRGRCVYVIPRYNKYLIITGRRVCYRKVRKTYFEPRRTFVSQKQISAEVFRKKLTVFTKPFPAPLKPTFAMISPLTTGKEIYHFIITASHASAMPTPDERFSIVWTSRTTLRMHWRILPLATCAVGKVWIPWESLTRHT